MLSLCPHDCPSVCALVVTVEDGRLVSVTGNPAHPFTQGVICGTVREYAERVHSPLRVKVPLRRVGAKGAGELAELSWEAAIETITRPHPRASRPRSTTQGMICRPSRARFSTRSNRA